MNIVMEEPQVYEEIPQSTISMYIMITALKYALRCPMYLARDTKGTQVGCTRCDCLSENKDKDILSTLELRQWRS